MRTTPAATVESVFLDISRELVMSGQRGRVRGPLQERLSEQLFVLFVRDAFLEATGTTPETLLSAQAHGPIQLAMEHTCTVLRDHFRLIEDKELTNEVGTLRSCFVTALQSVFRTFPAQETASRSGA